MGASACTTTLQKIDLASQQLTTICRAYTIRCHSRYALLRYSYLAGCFLILVEKFLRSIGAIAHRLRTRNAARRDRLRLGKTVARTLSQYTAGNLAHHVERACFLSSFAAFAAALRSPAMHLLSAGNICLGAWTAVYDDALGISDLEFAGFLAVSNVLILLPLIAIVTGICLYRESVYIRRHVTPFIFGVLF